MKARAFILACGAASLLLPALACADTPSETDAPLILQAGPRIIHVPQPATREHKRRLERPQKPLEPKPHVEHPQPPEPKRQVERPQDPPESKRQVERPHGPPESKPQAEQPLQPPEPSESIAPRTGQAAPAQTPNFRRPAQTKANRKIWI